MANRFGELALGCQGEAVGIFDQGPSFIRRLFGLGLAQGQLEIVHRLAVEPFAQLHGGQLIEANRIVRWSTTWTSGAETGEGLFVLTDPQDLPAHEHGSGA